MLTGSYNVGIYNNNKSGLGSVKVGLNLGGGFGTVVGAPRLNGEMYSGGIFNTGYRAIGKSTAAIARIDFTFCNRITIAIMATATHYDIAPFGGAPPGSGGGESHETYALKGLIGINLSR